MNAGQHAAPSAVTCKAGLGCAGRIDLAFLHGCSGCAKVLHDKFEAAMKEQTGHHGIWYISGLLAALRQLSSLTPWTQFRDEAKILAAERAQSEHERATRERLRKFIKWFLTWISLKSLDYRKLQNTYDAKEVLKIKCEVAKLNDVELFKLTELDSTRVIFKNYISYCYEKALFWCDGDWWILCLYGCDVDVFRYFHEQAVGAGYEPGFRFPGPDAFHQVNENNIMANLDGIYLRSPAKWSALVDYLLEQGCPWVQSTLTKNLENDFDVVKKMILAYRKKGYPWYPHLSREAAKRGKFELLKFLRAEGAPIDKLCVRWAANSGHIEIVKWLLNDVKIQADPMMCARAAEGGELSCLKLLVDGGVKMNKATVLYAGREKVAKKKRKRETYSEWKNLGRIKCLQFALAYGAEGAEELLADAGISDHTRAYITQFLAYPGVNHWFHRVPYILTAEVQSKMPWKCAMVMQIVTNELRRYVFDFENEDFVGVL